MNQDIFFIAGPCVIESEEMCLTIAHSLRELSEKYSVQIIFKASYDKANRTSRNSFRGPGRHEGLRILEKVKKDTALNVLSDIHTPDQAQEAAEVVDVIQIPAFLCRQTDLLAAAGATGKKINIKKGQFSAPGDMQFAAEKAGKNVWLTERGTFFGYNRLVVDFTGFHEMKKLGYPLIFDATHSIQRPSAGDGCSAGEREQALPLAYSALFHGVSGLFFEIHPDPDAALCDGPNSLSVDTFKQHLPHFLETFNTVKKWQI